MRSFRETFLETAAAHGIGHEHTFSAWSEIEKRYGERTRYYHTLAHLDHIISELEPCRNNIVQWEAVVLATAYHDIIYNVLKQDNEERSADFAAEELSRMGWNDPTRDVCRKLILATHKHEPGDEDANLFIDADLAILGTDTDRYAKYVEQIRKEYEIFPDVVYKPGRKKVLRHFLNMSQIYKTSFFADKYEKTARINIEKELASL